MQKEQIAGTTVKVIVTGIGTWFTAIFGWAGWLIVIFLISGILDMVTGFAAAGKAGKWESHIARDGIIKKFGSVAILICAGMFDFMLVLMHDNIAAFTLPEWWPGVALLPIVTIWCTLTEIGSILENAGKLGAPIPKFFISIILILKKKAEITIPEGELQTIGAAQDEKSKESN